MPGFKICASVLCTILWLTAAGASAQTAPPAASPQTSAPDTATKGDEAPDATTVTILGKKQRRDRQQVRIDTRSAGSCGFARGYNAADDEVVQNYLDDFGGRDSINQDDFGNTTTDDDGTTTSDNSDPLRPGAQVRDTSPNGNATQNSSNADPNSNFVSKEAGGCTSADVAFAAGRNYILRKDHSLQDAYDAFDAGDYVKAIDLFKASYSKIGYDQAAFMVGKMYLSGLGVPRDTAQAIVWLKKVAEAKFAPGDEQGFDPAAPYDMSTRSDATMTLAKIYMMGWDVPRDPKEARKWYAQADKVGYIPAAHLLGKMYQSGYAGEKSLSKAMTYFDKAGHAGFTPSQYELGLIYYDGEEGVPEDRKIAAQWLMAAASGGHPDALYEVGRMYDMGDTLPQDSQKALVYYKDAALKGQAEAQNALGTYFYSGEMVGKDLGVARKWFELAAKQGQVDAMFNLAVMIAHGEGGNKDLAIAYVWFKLAAQAGHDKADAAARALEPQMTAEDKATAAKVLNPA